MPKQKISSDLKKDIASKLTIYKGKYSNGNCVELSMYQDLMKEQDIANYMQIGPYSGKELLESLEINKNLGQEDKIACLAMLADAFLEKGFEVNVYMPGRDEKEGFREKPLFATGSKPELKLSKWDKFWKFFGISTEHAREVKALQDAQEAKKNEIKAALVFNRSNNKRLVRNERLFTAEKAEYEKLLQLFVDDKTKQRVEQRTEKKAADINIKVGEYAISPQMYCVGRLLYAKQIDISNMEITEKGIMKSVINEKGVEKKVCVATAKEVKEIGKEFYRIALDVPEEERKDYIVRDIGGYDAMVDFYPEKKYIESNVELTAEELGKIAAYSGIKSKLNRTIRGIVKNHEVRVYRSHSDDSMKFNSVIYKAKEEKALCDDLMNGNIDAVYEKASNMIVGKVMKDLHDNTKKEIQKEVVSAFLKDNKQKDVKKVYENERKKAEKAVDRFLEKYTQEEAEKSKTKTGQFELKYEAEKLLRTDKLEKPLKERIKSEMEGKWTREAVDDLKAVIPISTKKEELNRRLDKAIAERWTPEVKDAVEKEVRKNLEKSFKGNGDKYAVTAAMVKNILDGNETYDISRFHNISYSSRPDLRKVKGALISGLNFPKTIIENPDMEDMEDIENDNPKMTEKVDMESGNVESEKQEPESDEMQEPEMQEPEM